MGKRKGKAPKRKFPSEPNEADEPVNAPQSFVIHRGLPCVHLDDLTKDFRRMMEPFTASSLKVSKSNKIKDFVHSSSVYNVSHMCVFNKTSTQLSFKTARLPRGPTLTFKVHQFTIAKDVIASVRKQYFSEEAFHYPPLIILNNFTGEGKHLKLMANTFQNMFPSINLANVQLSTMRRCIIYSYNPIAKLIDVRHFLLSVQPVDLNRGIKKVVLGKVPNLSKFEDISEFLTNGNATDSEYEDDETGEILLPQTLKSRGNIENNKSAIKLHELGPRLTLELTKIEDGLFTGEVLHHEKFIKTEEEIEAIRNERLKKKKLKEMRKRVQNENIKKKEILKDEHKTRTLSGMQKYQKNDDNMESDDDAEYYKEEVGVEPEKELFKGMSSSSSKKSFIPKYMQGAFAKKRKLESESQSDSKKQKLDNTKSTKFNKRTNSTDDFREFNGNKSTEGREKKSESIGRKNSSTKSLKCKVKKVKGKRSKKRLSAKQRNKRK